LFKLKKIWINRVSFLSRITLEHLMYYLHNYQGNRQNFQGNQIQQYPNETAQSGNIYKSNHYSMSHGSNIKMALIFDTKMISRRKHGKIKMYVSWNHYSISQKKIKGIQVLIVIQKGNVENKLVFILWGGGKINQVFLDKCFKRIVMA